jgi:signal transduction histidine kinase
MTERILKLAEQYTEALDLYLAGAGEDALQRAYELGREAIQSGLGVLDIAAVYQQALLKVLLRALTQEESTRAAQTAADFFIESLSPFEMAQRGYQDANATLLWLNETLERRKRADEERARLLALEQSARAAAETAQQRFSFLAEASTLLDASLDYEITLNSVARLAVPYVGDWCLVDVVEEDETVRRVAVAHADPTRNELASELHHGSDELNQYLGLGEVLAEGKSRLLGEVNEVAWSTYNLNEACVKVLRQLGMHSYMVVPLVARQRTLGAVTFVSSSPERHYTRDDLVLAEDLARRAAIAVDNARLYAQAQRAVQGRDEMLSIVSHDLRNPLGVILMTSMILARNAPKIGLESQHLDQLHAIKRSADRMNRLIQDLLDISKIEGGRLIVDRRMHTVTELVEDAMESLAPLAEKKRQQFTQHVENGNARIYADRERVYQIFSNLVGNAIKFTPEGGSITVSGRVVDEEVEFCVTDTGPGIPEENLPHVFDRFWQARHTARLGTGLGLTIARGITEAHGGRIWVESRVGEGSKFCFALPLVRSAELQSAEAAS